MEAEVFNGQVIDNTCFNLYKDEDVIHLRDRSYYGIDLYLRVIKPFYKLSDTEITFLSYCIKKLQLKYKYTHKIVTVVITDQRFNEDCEKTVGLSYSKIKDCIYHLTKRGIVNKLKKENSEKYYVNKIVINTKIIPENLITNKAVSVFIKL